MMPITVAEVAKLLRTYKLRCGPEGPLQIQIAAIFAANGIAFVPEMPLCKRDRIDFYVPLRGDVVGVGVEVKVADSWTNVTRQLLRYAESEAILGLVLVTTRATHVKFIPDTLGGKPVAIVSTLESAL